VVLKGRVTGYSLLCLGSIVALAACVFRRPNFIIISGYFVDGWLLKLPILILGLVLASLGVVSLFRSAN